MLMWTIAAGLGLGAGVVCLVAAFLPSRPDLRAALAHTTNPPPRERHRWTWATVARLPYRDLPLDDDPTRHVLRKLAGAALGALLPGTLAALSALATGTVPFAVGGVVVLAGTIAGFVLPDLVVRARARRQRAAMRHAVGAYLMLVALERRAGSAAQQALVRAARVADTCEAFAHIRASLDRAQLDRRPAWEGLHALAARVHVTELRDCADIMAASTDGAAVTDTLLARARGLRGETLNQQRARANEASERMVVPVALLGLCFTALLMYPVLIRLLTL
ncbi:hypothetical protein NI17_010445 [Thermobifida halotolerans]|uniref:Uncharacterized protein n=1 Tax=Thermobifida halotolerans TaxID=483545 RepID=A0A399FYB5_9ACTN|nr:hypothetical protein [Thermobifida halotolerans]UOE21481.1 hypothetical protein NI17_010445 [Thermobifida halotolerans]